MHEHFHVSGRNTTVSRFIATMSAHTARMPERSELATSTAGPVFWGERLGTVFAAMRLSRNPKCAIETLREGDVVRVHGKVCATSETILSPVWGKPAVFGRIAVGADEKRAVMRLEDGKYTSTHLYADVTYGDGFAIEDDTGRAIVSLSKADPFELFVKVGRMRSGYCTERLEAFVERDPAYQSLLALDQVSDAIAAEWTILEGATVSILAKVTHTIATPSDDYRAMKRLPVLGVRGVKPIVVF